MRIFMAGAISGNLSPMWRSMYNVIRVGGIPNEEYELRKFINEGISGRQLDMDIPHSDFRGGGIPNLTNENLLGTRSKQVGDIRLGGSVHSRGGCP